MALKLPLAYYVTRILAFRSVDYIHNASCLKRDPSIIAVFEQINFGLFKRVRTVINPWLIWTRELKQGCKDFHLATDSSGVKRQTESGGMLCLRPL